MLMPGRSLDTAGICVTSYGVTEIPHFTWINPGTPASVAAIYGAASLTGQTNGGMAASGTGGGLSYVISGITAYSIQLSAYFSAISGTATITAWKGTNTSSTGIQLGSTTTGVTSPAPSLSITPMGTLTTPATVTVTIAMPAASSRTLFTVDSIGYTKRYDIAVTSVYTRCGSPVDKYEFGFNGHMKSNEIAGIGNTLSFEFRTYNSRLCRFTSNDPRGGEYPWQSTYAYYRNSPIATIDYLGMGEFYNKDGRYLGSDGKTKTIGKGAKAKQVPDDKAYTAETANGDGTFKNAQELSVSNSTLNRFANTVAKESSGNQKESFALASTISNLAKYKGKSIQNTLETEGIYGYTNGGNSTSYNDNHNYGMGAAINALTGGTDYSGGAIRWDGVDLAEYGFNQYKGRTAGFSISPELFSSFQAAWPNSAITQTRGRSATFSNNFSAGIHLATEGDNQGMCLYNALSMHGRTMFWGKNGTGFNYPGRAKVNGFHSDGPCIQIDKFYPNSKFTGRY